MDYIKMVVTLATEEEVTIDEDIIYVNCQGSMGLPASLRIRMLNYDDEYGTIFTEGDFLEVYMGTEWEGDEDITLWFGGQIYEIDADDDHVTLGCYGYGIRTVSAKVNEELFGSDIGTHIDLLVRQYANLIETDLDYSKRRKMRARNDSILQSSTEHSHHPDPTHRPCFQTYRE